MCAHAILFWCRPYILEYTRIYTGIYWCQPYILVYCRIYWKILENTGKYWKVLDYTGIYWNILKYTGIYWNILEYTGLYWYILELMEYTGRHIKRQLLLVLCADAILSWCQPYKLEYNIISETLVTGMEYIGNIYGIKCQLGSACVRMPSCPGASQPCGQLASQQR